MSAFCNFFLNVNSAHSNPSGRLEIIMLTFFNVMNIMLVASSTVRLPHPTQCKLFTQAEGIHV